MKILVCNVGSTSLKAKLYEMPEERELCQGKIERVGSLDDSIFSYHNTATGQEKKCTGCCIPDYRRGIEMFLEVMLSSEIGVIKDPEEIERVGFKTVLAKGYYGIHQLTEDVMSAMEEMMPIAPSHNGPYLQAIRTMREVFPQAVFIGAFETAFHQSIPQERVMYGVPYEWYKQLGVRRMGYHGASHSYIASVLNQSRANYRAISCHLGGSGSICAIKDGKSVDTSFGMTLQTGPIHANRTGDMDCDLYAYLKSQGLNEKEISDGMTKNGGLKGISGISGDLRYVQSAADEGNERARLAIAMYVHGIVHYIGAFYAEMGGVDTLVFTGGIGENAWEIRQAVCETLHHMGFWLDQGKNQLAHPDVISQPNSPVEIRVIRTNEEICVARSAYSCQS